MSSAPNPKGASNVKRRTWDKSKYDLEARERANKLQEARTKLLVDAKKRNAALDTASAEEEARRIVAEELLGGRAGEVEEEELRERAKEVLGAKEDDAKPLFSKRAYARKRDYAIKVDDRVGQRRIVTDATPAHKSGDFVSVVTGAKLHDSLQYFKHINGRKHNAALGYSTRTARVSADEVKDAIASVSSNPSSAAQEPSVEDIMARADRLAEEQKSRRKRRRKKKDDDNSDNNNNPSPSPIPSKPEATPEPIAPPEPKRARTIKQRPPKKHRQPISLPPWPPSPIDPNLAYLLGVEEMKPHATIEL